MLVTINVKPADQQRSGAVLRTSVAPGVARQLLAHELAVMCREATTSHQALATRLGVSRASVTQMVAGKNLPSRAVLEVVVDQLNQQHRLSYLFELLALARAGAAGSTDLDLALGLEATAATITIVDTTAVPTLLRTQPYARHLLQAAPLPTVDDQLARRQQVIYSGNPPTSLLWITEEHALTRLVGGPEVMIEQYQHLLARTDQPHIQIFVIPNRPRSIIRPIPPFQMFTRDDGHTVVHEKTVRTAHYTSGTPDVAAFNDLVSELQRLSLDADRSRQLLAELAGRGPARLSACRA